MGAPNVAWEPCEGGEFGDGMDRDSGGGWSGGVLEWKDRARERPVSRSWGPFLEAERRLKI